MRIAPAGEALRAGDVLLRHVQAARVPDPAVEHGNLPMVPVAEGVQLPQRREWVHPDALRDERAHVPSTQHGEAADRVVQDSDGHALLDLVREQSSDLLGERIRGPLVVEQVNRL